ncbi:DUF6057 family protein [Prevotella sp. E2-28]|uniref:DUF6057 family protein n=1 Tax=Prevotella sp. E2-28 TaxID=2913620 RepID=UPI001EDC7583|nr:DUF6057 family protein [Prevotella sp. E2-28]UKK54444.1 DUF6057 family protein [Prevotella sp. E2-28]
MIKTNKVSGATLYASLLAFISFVVYILYINQEVLYTAHDRSEFIFGAPFFHTLMSKPFGLMQYVGAWLTQLFYHPALGAAVLVVIWILIFLVGTKAFQLQGKTMGQCVSGNSASSLMLLPIACLLTSVVDLGYWIYIFPIRGYWFSQSVGYLFMLLLLWAARSTTPRKWHLAWYLFGACLYPVLGWFALLFILCLLLAEKPSWQELLGIVLLFITAAICHTQLYSNLKTDDVVLAGLPRFETPMDSSEHLSLPFWMLGALSVVIVLCGKYLAKWFVPVLCAAAGIIFTTSLMYYDKNYIDEMRMVRYASNDNWKEVLNLAEDNKKPTGTMIFLKNIALMNEGGLLERSFKLGNDAANINNPDTLHVTLLDIASPLVYYNYGMLNEAIRLNFENAIQAGFSPFYLKMLARCAQAKGDKKLVERYTTILHHHPFYGDWQPAPVAANINELQKSFPDELTGVENSESYLVNGISLWYESDSKVTSEQALFYAMLRCDSRRFWASLRNYVALHMNEEFPLHAMEAYILFIDKAPEERRMMLPVEQSVYERYKYFWEVLESKAKPGMTIEQVGEEMREEFGDTYWWYNIFGRKPINISGNVGHELQS